MALVPPRRWPVLLRAFEESDAEMAVEMSEDLWLPLIDSLPAHTDRAGDMCRYAALRRR